MSSNAPHLIVGGDSVIGRKLWFYWNSCGISVCTTTRRCTGETRAAPMSISLQKSGVHYSRRDIGQLSFAQELLRFRSAKIIRAQVCA